MIDTSLIKTVFSKLYKIWQKKPTFNITFAYINWLKTIYQKTVLIFFFLLYGYFLWRIKYILAWIKK